MNRWRNLQRPTNKDEDHDEVVKRLRAIGATVVEIFKPLDLLVGYQGVTMLLEIKGKLGPRGGKSKRGQKLRDTQQDFIDTWQGAAPLVVTLDTCVAAVEEAAFNVGVIDDENAREREL